MGPVVGAALAATTVAAVVAPTAIAEPSSSPAETTTSTTSAPTTAPVSTTTVPSPTQDEKPTATTTTKAESSKPATSTTAKPTRPSDWVKPHIGLVDYTKPTVDTPTAKKGITFLGLKPYFVYISCDDRAGHNGRPTNISSDALDLGSLERISGGYYPHAASWAVNASVKDSAPAGKHTVSAQCGDEKLSYTFEVLPGDPGTTAPKPAQDAASAKEAQAKARTQAAKRNVSTQRGGNAQVKIRPKGRIETGAGGTTRG
ncbi:hypothetical protein GCM10012275_43470 [Longimycelium tulufanense]|uniref:Uncharacterized protein n=1 Tax=Longimycelium tulufanense TaxID=907463 RepID=A0A8J3FW20_9PSEU|nr:hypothetical protein GCM10012275_43470 [Longimycelium tulufanense]